ncbi:hypothetical protein [Mesorhizobium sp. M0029]|uniref:hypothetical protein n=1 Tax=Mesorhizobium sp. M0029 TaxID=2956850 RepID=UPI0033355F63
MKPFWLTAPISPQYDVVVLRPFADAKRSHFETVNDVSRYSKDLESRLLRKPKPCRTESEILSDCRHGYYDCEKPFCPKCARVFRRWLASRTLRLFGKRRAHVVTIFLQEVAVGALHSTDPIKLRNRLRIKLMRAGVEHSAMVGGIEAGFKADRASWLLHSHFVVEGDMESELRRLEVGSSTSRVPLMIQALNEPTAQLPYMLKFHSYHRPTPSQRAYPLKPTQTKELVRWQGQYAFQDFLFLRGLRRRGPDLERL